MKTFIDLFGRIRDKSQAWRGWILFAAAVLFVFGSIVAFGRLDRSYAEMNPILLMLCAAFFPLTLAYGTVGLLLLARAAKVTLEPLRATGICLFATVAEMLPVPGGAIVRTTALAHAGASLVQSSALVIGTGLLWVAVATTGTGLALAASSSAIGWPIAIAGGVGSSLIVRWLARRSTARLAWLTLLHRAAGLALMALRLQLAFLVLGQWVKFDQTLPFVTASILGSAASLVPAGLGLSESLAASVATLGPVSPELAFLAVGLDRVVCFTAASVVAVVIQVPKLRRRVTT